MPGQEQLAELRQKLDQLNRLEEEGARSRRCGRSALDSEALMESLRANLPLNVLLQHDRLRARGRCSATEVRHGVCSGCHMTLPLGTHAELKRRAKLVRCDNCGRFVFLAEQEAEGAPALKTQTAVQPVRRSARSR